MCNKDIQLEIFKAEKILNELGIKLTQSGRTDIGSDIEKIEKELMFIRCNIEDYRPK